MKRVGFLYNDMLDKNLIEKSIFKALQRKKETKEVLKIKNNINYYVDYFYEEIENETYNFNTGHIKTINNGKKVRQIQVPNIYDHIMQHIMMSVLSPIITKSMYKWNCGVVPKRGCIYAKNYVEKVIGKHKPKYSLKIDVKKYYHNIDTRVLMQQLERKIKDKRFLNLTNDLLTTANNGTHKGIPIGYYSSQWLSNLYLEELDYYIKQELKIEWYARYVDDLVLMGNNKRELHRAKIKIFRYMKDVLKLEPNKNYQVFPISKRPIDFVGYKFSYGKIRLRKDTFKKYMRRYNDLLNKTNIYLCRSYLSLRGWLTHIKMGKNHLSNANSIYLYMKTTIYVSKKDKERYYGLC